MYNFFIYLLLGLFLFALLLFVLVGVLLPWVGLVFFLFLAFFFFLFSFFRQRLASQSEKGVESLKEEINLLNDSLEKKNKIIAYLPSKQEKASSLVKLSQELVELDDPDDIFDFLVSVAEKLFPHFDFISLFEFDRKTHLLKLARSSKKNSVKIKEKQGGKIENWMLKQNSSVVIEDIRKDFRFDSAQIEAFSQRNSLSFLASPLSVGSEFFGAIRVESKKEGFFSHDDLRFLINICDLGAVVLERAYLLKQVQELAVTDSLTGLSLRNHFNEKLENEIKRAALKKSKLALIMFDIDDFKKINDSHGHVVGDLVLKKIARLLKQLAKNSRITVCRYGGEEFMALITDTERGEAVSIIQNLREKITAATVAYRRKKVNFTVSVGLAVCPDDQSSFEALLEGVDQLMYKAKKEGKNRVCYRF